MPGKLLLIDDDLAVLSALQRLLRPLLKAEQIELLCTDDPQAGLAMAQEHQPDLIICDQRMPAMEGTELMQQLAEKGSAGQRFILSGFADFSQVIEAFNRGDIQQFIAKPWDDAALLESVRRIYSHPVAVNEAGLFHGMLSHDPAMQQMFDRLKRLALANAPVFLCGETGTGKELAARAIHREGPRSDRAFVAVNCANFNEQMMDAELFGHRKGAFTGAVEDRKGLLQEADGGTLFLDEVTTLPLALQAKLLRVLQERKYRPVGDNREQSFDVQLISASSQSMQDAVDRGEFRPDLQYRLEVLPLQIPPLRQRSGDIIPLLQHFLIQLQLPDSVTLSPELQSTLAAHSWPGNIRQLYNVAQYLAAMWDGKQPELDTDLLPQHILCINCPTECVEETTLPLTPHRSYKPLQEMDAAELDQLLAEHQGNRTATAAALGVSRMTLWRRMKELTEVG